MNDFITQLLATAAPDASWFGTFQRWANAESPGELVLLVFGLLAQAIFFGRWVVQWLASERRGESHMPELFWWLSLLGASMLLVYFILRHEPVGMIGQCVGWTVYARNLHLIHRARRKPA